MPGLKLMYQKTLVFLVKKYKSLIQILNKSGPRTDPCGTPKNMCAHLVKHLFSFFLCHLLVK